MALSLTLQAVRDLAREYALIPLCLDVIADLETPVTAYLKVARGEYSFLLESVEGGERQARYSFIGTEPRAVLLFRGERGERLGAGGRREVIPCGDPLPLLTEEVLGARAYVDPALPPLVGGAVGYLGYEMVRQWEPHVPHTPGPTVEMPDGVLMLTDTVLAFDHLAHRIKIVTHVRPAEHGSVEEAYEAAVARLAEIMARLRAPLTREAVRSSRHEPSPISSNVTREEHEAGVERIRQMILGGEAIQVVLSQRFARPTRARPFDIYRALRTVNPTPYMYFIHAGDVQIAGASVETLVRVTGRDIYYHPIAGTRPRGCNEKEDLALEEELRADVKERAEHIMLVDLGRNDVGRVSEAGTVRVSDLMSVERYSHVMHLVSTVEGHLAEGLTALDALRACFPAGTVAGAPKVRAMEILAETERGSRNLYAGAVGYVTYGGDLDTCIAFRTAVVKDGVAYVQAGGGIVADSVPANEYMETVHKAAAVLRAIDLAETGLNGDQLPAEH
ncbi:MAG TPA: anthranilate synthase component I [Chloroflexota bacterium]|nr:anthranilate synthase component I [Chloroflexota bacterium]